MKGNEPEDRKDSYYWRSRDVKRLKDGKPVTKNSKTISHEDSNVASPSQSLQICADCAGGPRTRIVVKSSHAQIFAAL